MNVSDIMVCLDCMTTEQQGTEPDDPDRTPWGLVNGLDQLHYVLTDDHDDFGTHPCDACGSTLAGERFGYDYVD